MTRITTIVRVTQERIDRYGKVNGDAEKLHYDPAYAKDRGFRNTIAHGTMLLAPVFDLALRRFGHRFLFTGTLYIKWMAPICEGDVQHCSIDDRGAVEVVIDNLPDRPIAIRGEISCGDPFA